MARASLNPDRAKQGGGSIEAGNYEVLTAKFANIKTDYRPNQLYMVLGCAVLDKDGDKVRGAEDVEITLSFGEKSLESFHPGQADSPDDEPSDQGDGVDAEGNTIWCEEDAQFNKSCAAMVFMETLSKAGFPKSTLDRCWAGDYVGLKFALTTEEPKKLNEKYGLRLNTKPMKDRQTGEPVNITYKIADKWLNPNYLTGGGTAKAKGGKANGQAAEEASDRPTDPQEIAAHVLAEVAKLKPGEKNKIKSKQALVGFFTNAYTKAKFDPKKLAEVQKIVKDDDWLVGAVAELGGSYDEGVTTFAAE